MYLDPTYNRCAICVLYGLYRADYSRCETVVMRRRGWSWLRGYTFPAIHGGHHGGVYPPPYFHSQGPGLDFDYILLYIYYLSNIVYIYSLSADTIRGIIYICLSFRHRRGGSVVTVAACRCYTTHTLHYYSVRCNYLLRVRLSIVAETLCCC